MATVTALTAARMLAIEAASVISGVVTGDNLILTKFDNSTINAGNVRGPQGLTPTFRGSSVTSLAIGTGSKTFAISPAMSVAFPVGSIVKAVGSTVTNYMVGDVTASSTTSVTINVTEVGGTGTFASWTLTIGAFKGVDGNPTGAILPYGGSTAPTGYLLADGTAVSRTGANAALFAVVGTTYGAGDGSTTFNLPNLKGQVPVGRDSAQTEFDVLGEPGGAKTHTLLAAEMPSHSHTIPAHTHTISGISNVIRWLGSGGSLASPGAGTAMNGETLSVTGGGGGATSLTGSGTAHNNLQPYLVVNYIIKL